jgi:fatty aldehyde-generating acyl-ACP reductase
VIDVALIGHLESTPDYAKLLTELRSGVRPDEAALPGLLRHLEPAPVCDVRLASTRGDRILAQYIDLFLVADTSFNAASARGKLERACREARATGARVAALGGFASIVGERDADLAVAYGLAFTTGNTLTAATLATQIASIAEEDMTVTVVGAAGDVGSGLCRLLGRCGQRLILVGRSPKPLASLAAELGGLETSSMEAALPRTDILVLVASAPLGAVSLAGLPSHARVVDAGHPRNASATRLPYARGGRVRHAVLPSSELPIVLRFEGPPGESHACLAEACVLAYESCFEACSVGRGRITVAAADAMLALAARHGVTPAPLHWSPECSGWAAQAHRA